jgi:hypothetical protein
MTSRVDAPRHGHWRPWSAPAAPPCAPRFVIVSAIATSSGSGRTAESRDAERQTGHYGNDSVHRGRSVARKRACVLVATWGQRAGSLSFVTTRPWRGAVPAGRYDDYYAQALRACAMQPAQK